MRTRIRGSRFAVAIGVIAASMALAAIESARHSVAFAQAVTGAPGAPVAPRIVGAPQNTTGTRSVTSLVLPATRPAAPVAGAPAAFNTASALPRLAPAPIVVQAAPMPGQQSFRCSCFGFGTGTRWIGVVPAANFTQADAAAQGQCVNYLLNSNAPSSSLPVSAGGFTTRSPYPAVNPNIAPGNVATFRTGITAQTQISAAAAGAATLATYCQRCACN